MATPPSPQEKTKRRATFVRIAVALVSVGSLLPVATILRREGVNDLALLATSARPLDPQQPSTADVGHLVTVTGPLQTEPPIGDTYLRPGHYVLVERRVEMRSWQERREGLKVAYDLIWTGSPSPSEGFKQPDGHENPPRRIGNDKWFADMVKVGRVLVPRPAWDPTPVALTASQVQRGRLVAGWLYPPDVDPVHPRPGDARIAYWGVPAGRLVTAVGVLGKDGNLTPYRDARTARYPGAGGALFDVLPGDRDQALEALQAAYPAQPNWPRRLEMLGWLFLSVIGWRYVFKR
jgi:hypothetical protein